MSEKPIEKQIKELLPRITQIFASSNINFLIWSGASKDFLPTLNTIEDDINSATDDISKAEKYKEYFEKVMLPNKMIISWDFGSEKLFKWDDSGTVPSWTIRTKVEAEGEFSKTYTIYIEFLKVLTQLVLDRKTTVLSRQVNLFTTNIDIFLEYALESLGLHYNDGFLWRLNAIFDLSNFKQSIIQRSHHFDNRSEIPVFNLLKIHWSLTWKYKSQTPSPDQKISLSWDLSHFDSTLMTKTGIDFINEYKSKLLIVNPEESKFSQTVLNTYYYELLRSYSSELEKENSVLFIVWFSMVDRHIREITKRAARSNPTLQIFIFLFSSRQKSKIETWMEIDKNPNIKIISPEYTEAVDKYSFDLETITKEVLSEINFNQKTNGSE